MSFFKFLSRLRHDNAGATIVEFALLLPTLAMFGLGGMEIAQYVRTHMSISQISVTAADNASRAKEEVVGGAPRFSEGDIEQIFAAVERQTRHLDFESRGRLVMSSIQKEGPNRQVIKWQRCFGDGDFDPSYGVQGTGASGRVYAAFGPDGHSVSAESGEAVIMVEIFYPYDSILGVDQYSDFLSPTTIRYVSSALVRDDRDLSQIFSTTGVTPATCD